jgi:hypothetical protein
MDISSFSQPQRTAIDAAFSYWLEHWDWEMPTLTGLTLEEFRSAAHAWRESSSEVPKNVLLAALGALRECSAQAEEPKVMLGLGPEQAQALMQVLAEGCDDAV